MQKLKININFYSFQSFIRYYKYKNAQHKVKQNALNIATFLAVLRDIFVKHKKEIPNQSYYIHPPETDLIQQADDLYEQQKYMEVYHLLNQLRADDAKFCSNPEVLWRISRALYVMSQNDLFAKSICEEMIQEAYRLIRFALSTNNDNADLHKWNAILIDGTAGYIGTYTRIGVMPDVKKHLLRAAELKPSDVTILYMLGHLCYQLASLSWFQRQIANFLFMSPPSATYEEAYNYFLMVETLQPRFFLSNTYMLGKVSFHMKQCYRAKYYLDIAASLPYRTEQEKKYSQEAKKLSKELHRYDVSKAALFYGLGT